VRAARDASGRWSGGLVSRRGRRVEQQAGAGAGAASVARWLRRKAVRALTQAHGWSSHAGRAATNGWRSAQERVQAARARRKSGHWNGAIQATQAARPRVGGPSGGWRPGARRRSCGGKLLLEMRERGGRIEDAAKVFDEMLAHAVLKNARVLLLDEASRVQDAVGRMLQRRAGQRRAGRTRVVREELQCDGCGRIRTGAVEPRVENVGGR
jgi:hypothetical protein